VTGAVLPSVALGLTATFLAVLVAGGDNPANLAGRIARAVVEFLSFGLLAVAIGWPLMGTPAGPPMPLRLLFVAVLVAYAHLRALPWLRGWLAAGRE
jgi:hypothetical protein